MKRSIRSVGWELVAAALTVSATTLLTLAVQANAITAGFVYLVCLLALTVWQGFLAGVAGSVLATGCFNYFFLPPVGTFHVADPENWVALSAFLIATTIASRLVARERERADEAENRKREIEALYELCVDLFTAGAATGGLDAATSRALRTIGARGGGLALSGSFAVQGSAGEWIGSPRDLEMHRLLRTDERSDPATGEGGWRNARVPVRAGGALAGELVVYGTRANPETLESVARLISLALEREHLFAEQARLAALKQSDAMKTALLQAVSHDLSTPLTAITVSTAALKRSVADRPDAAEAVELIVTETSRLHRRVQNLLDLARLEAGSVRPDCEPTPPADLFRAARENLPDLVLSRAFETRVEPGCPDLHVDPSLALEIVVNLIENAHRASPREAKVELVARHDPDRPGRVIVEVLDRGRGLESTSGDRAGAGAVSVPGDTGRKGLGLEIARRFASALDGDLALSSREGGGVCARIGFPASSLQPVSGVEAH